MVLNEAASCSNSSRLLTVTRLAKSRCAIRWVPFCSSSSGKHAAPDLADAEQQHRQAGKPDHDEEGVGELHHRLEHFVLGLAEQHASRAGAANAASSGMADSRRSDSSALVLATRVSTQVSLAAPECAPAAGRSVELNKTRPELIQHRHPGVRRGHALVHRAPEIVWADLAHEGASYYAFAVPAGAAGRLADRPPEVHVTDTSGKPSRRSELSRALRLGRRASRPNTSMRLLVVTHELHGHKSLPGEQVQPRDQGLAGFDQVGPGPVGGGSLGLCGR